MEYLSDETIINVVRYLAVDDFINLCSTSNRFRYFCDDQKVWKYFFIRDYVGNSSYRLKIYQHFIGPVSDWKQAYLMVDSDLLLRSPDFITVTEYLSEIVGLENIRFRDIEYGRVLDIGMIHWPGNISFIIPENKRMKAILTFKNVRIASTSITQNNITRLFVDGAIQYNLQNHKDYWTWRTY